MSCKVEAKNLGGRGASSKSEAKVWRRTSGGRTPPYLPASYIPVGSYSTFSQKKERKILTSSFKGLRNMYTY